MNDDQQLALETELAGLFAAPAPALRQRVARRVAGELRRRQAREGTGYLATVAAVLMLWAGFSWTINRNTELGGPAAHRTNGAGESLAQREWDTSLTQVFPLRAGASLGHDANLRRESILRAANF